MLKPAYRSGFFTTAPAFCCAAPFRQPARGKPTDRGFLTRERSRIAESASGRLTRLYSSIQEQRYE
jgi:hypothetical protein